MKLRSLSESVNDYWYHGTTIDRAKRFLEHGFDPSQKVHALRRQQEASWVNNLKMGIVYAISTSIKDFKRQGSTSLPAVLIAILESKGVDEDAIRADIEKGFRDKIDDSQLMQYPAYISLKTRNADWKSVLRAIYSGEFEGYQPQNQDYAKTNSFQFVDLLIYPGPDKLPNRQRGRLNKEYGIPEHLASDLARVYNLQDGSSILVTDFERSVQS